MKHLLYFVFFIFSYSSFSQKTQKITIIIDPGHGGNDHGKKIGSNKLKTEKAINLLIANKLGQYLTQNLPYVKVIYTRKDDRYLSLIKRCTIANKNNATYFISIHCNSSSNRYVVGTETHIHTKDFKKSLKLAQFIETEFNKRARRKSRGIKTKRDRKHNLQVLYDTNMPSVLIECGFLSNKSEEIYLNSNYGQEIIASAIFRAIRSMIYYEYPHLKKLEPIASSQKKKPSYRIQFMASIDPIDTKSKEFKKLKHNVKRLKIEYKSIYNYKYLVGECKSIEEAKKLLKQVKKLGYKDAYIIKL